MNLWPLLELLLCLSVCQSQKQEQPPNIIFIFADEVGWDDVSFHGSTQIPTPNLDALAADGVILNNYYVQPECTPSRSALMTGLYPIHTATQHSVIMPAEPWGLPLEHKLMPQHLKDLGYETHIVGKWHIGCASKEYTPTYRGFDSFYGFYNGEEDYYNHTLRTDDHVGLDFWFNNEPLWNETGHYSTTLYTERARNLIRNRKKGKPLFLYLSHQATHAGSDVEFAAPAENIEKFPYIGEEERTMYAACRTGLGPSCIGSPLQRWGGACPGDHRESPSPSVGLLHLLVVEALLDTLDGSVGAVMEALYEEDMLANSIVVFSSDNGGTPFGPHSTRSFNWPLRGAKSALWEGSTRVPAFIWSPFLSKKRRVSRQLMHITDWLPTLYSAAGGTPEKLGGHLDGIEMWRHLSLDLPSPRSEMLYNIDRIERIGALRSGNHKLVLGTYRDGEYDGRFKTSGNPRPYDDLEELTANSSVAHVLRSFYGVDDLQFSRDWRKSATLKCGRKEVEHSNFVGGQTTYLFDVANDPCELNNLASSKPKLVASLLKKMQPYAASALRPGNLPADENGYPEHLNGTWAPWM